VKEYEGSGGRDLTEETQERLSQPRRGKDKRQSGTVSRP
jgi:hypothetical protein